MALNHANYGSERHDSWFGVEALTRTTRGSPESEYSMSVNTSKQFSRTESNMLAMALIAHITNKYSMRYLFIKGVGAVKLGIRPNRPSADIDVLVHPDDFAELLLHLKNLDWMERPIENGLPFPQHSVTLYHGDWPTDIDLHYRFPGLDREPSEVFVTLEDESIIHDFNFGSGRIPNTSGAIVIQAVHALRPVGPDCGSIADNVDVKFLLDGCRLPPWSEILNVAHATGSLGTLEPFLRLAYPEQTSKFAFPKVSEEWSLRTRTSVNGARRVLQIMEADRNDRFTILARSILRSRADLAIADISALTADRKTLMRMRWRRYVRILRDLPHILKTIRDVRLRSDE